MTHTNTPQGRTGGSYTEHLSDVKELLARLDERQRDIRADLLEIKLAVRANADKAARHDARLAVLDTRQKAVVGSLALVGGGVVTVLVEMLLK